LGLGNLAHIGGSLATWKRDNQIRVARDQHPHIATRTGARPRTVKLIVNRVSLDRNAVLRSPLGGKLIRTGWASTVDYDAWLGHIQDQGQIRRVCIITTTAD
jgi:hypothetical protein